jgi:hypothetical protein
MDFETRFNRPSIKSACTPECFETIPSDWLSSKLWFCEKQLRPHAQRPEFSEFRSTDSAMMMVFENPSVMAEGRSGFG